MYFIILCLIKENKASTQKFLRQILGRYFKRQYRVESNKIILSMRFRIKTKITIKQKKKVILQQLLSSSQQQPSEKQQQNTFQQIVDFFINIDTRLLCGYFFVARLNKQITKQQNKQINILINKQIKT
eukprot:TRINITY_DN5688_c0_g3_i1.p5 TRINITY_DN5688_c0_g3~~TRINITY_DN5688_c0_g3_i1.p5  ORF type:complete len:128 (-),score=2.23 TRINITY_DN5688_c0_g3_i1:155-538(-)